MRCLHHKKCIFSVKYHYSMKAEGNGTRNFHKNPLTFYLILEIYI